MMLFFLFIFFNGVYFSLATKQRTGIIESHRTVNLRTWIKDVTLQNSRRSVIGNSDSEWPRYIISEDGPRTPSGRSSGPPSQHRWSRFSFAQAHGDRHPIRSAEQKANIDGMARMLTSCFDLFTEKECHFLTLIIFGTEIKYLSSFGFGTWTWNSVKFNFC